MGIYGDTIFERDESFKVRIHNATAPPASGVIGAPVPYPIADDVAVVTLLNDDARPPKPPRPTQPECTIAYMKERYAHHPFFNGGSQFFGLMRLAAKGLGPGGITALREGSGGA